MKYIDQPKVRPDLREESKRHIDACNKLVDEMHGTIIVIECISHGQPRPYADSVYESRILCFRPNVWTTNGPAGSYIDEILARHLARTFVRDWGEHEKPYLGGYLEFIRPEVKDPIGFERPFERDGKMVSCCWRVRVREPFTD
jgi:hypothetical protein